MLEDKDQDISHILYNRDKKKKTYKNQRGHAEAQELTNSNSRKSDQKGDRKEISKL